MADSEDKDVELNEDHFEEVGDDTEKTETEKRFGFKDTSKQEMEKAGVLDSEKPELKESEEASGDLYDDMKKEDEDVELEVEMVEEDSGDEIEEESEEDSDVEDDPSVSGTQRKYNQIRNEGRNRRKYMRSGKGTRY